METADWITEAQRRVDASTAGHWRVWATSVMAGPPDSADHAEHIDVATTFCTDANGRPRTYDAVFIAAAHQDLPKALRALSAALALADAYEKYAVTCDRDAQTGSSDSPTRQHWRREADYARLAARRIRHALGD